MQGFYWGSRRTAEYRSYWRWNVLSIYWRNRRKIRRRCCIESYRRGTEYGRSQRSYLYRRNCRLSGTKQWWPDTDTGRKHSEYGKCHWQLCRQFDRRSDRIYSRQGWNISNDRRYQKYRSSQRAKYYRRCVRILYQHYGHSSRRHCQYRGSGRQSLG